jgi:HSP20 family protein
MKLIRYDYPTWPSRTDYDRVLTSLPAFSRLTSVFDSLLHGASWTGSPAVDLYEDDSHFYIKSELPGVKKDDINVTVENAVVTIAAKRVDKAKGAETAETTAFTRSLSVPEGADASKLAAAYENGVLTLTLPKQEARKPRRITVA